MSWPWMETSDDLLYYRAFLNDFSGPRVYVAPVVGYTINYSESSQDLAYYRRFLGNI